MNEFVPGGRRPARAPVTGNSDAVTGYASELERRIRVRMAEAEDAARTGRESLRAALTPGGSGRVPYIGAAELERLARVVRLHEMLAEALNDVLRGGF